MSQDSFKALVLTQEDKKTIATIQSLTLDDLPEGDVLVAVDYSSLNYKDGLAVTGKGKIVRQFPLVPGIDLAGTVLESSTPAYQVGDKVVLTGWSVGERYWVVIPKRPACNHAGWCPYQRAWIPERPWRLVRLVSLPCCVSWLWKRQASHPVGINRYW